MCDDMYEVELTGQQVNALLIILNTVSVKGIDGAEMILSIKRAIDDAIAVGGEVDDKQGTDVKV